MPTFNVFLKDKPKFLIIEADEAELGNLHLELKIGTNVIASFRSGEVQGYFQEPEKK